MEVLDGVEFDWALSANLVEGLSRLLFDLHGVVQTLDESGFLLL